MPSCPSYVNQVEELSFPLRPSNCCVRSLFCSIVRNSDALSPPFSKILRSLSLISFVRQPRRPHHVWLGNSPDDVSAGSEQFLPIDGSDLRAVCYVKRFLVRSPILVVHPGCSSCLTRLRRRARLLAVVRAPSRLTERALPSHGSSFLKSYLQDAIGSDLA